MSKNLSLQELNRIPLFAGFDQDVLTALALRSTEIVVSEHEWIFEEDDAATALYIILEGEVDIRSLMDASRLNYADVATLVAGDMIGWSALVEPYIYRMGALARSDTRLARFSARDLHDVMADYPETGCMLMTRVAQIVGGRLDALRTRFVSLIKA